MTTLGIRSVGGGPPAAEMMEGTSRHRSLGEERSELNRELDILSTAAEAQGWSVKTRTESVFRLLSPDGTRYSFPLGAPYETRVALRGLARELNEQGLRLNRTLTFPIDAVPPPPGERVTEAAKRKKTSPRSPARRSRRTG